MVWLVLALPILAAIAPPALAQQQREQRQRPAEREEDAPEQQGQ